MPRNTLADLNNHLFEQLERLNDEELDEESLKTEIKRSQAMTGIAQAIIGNAEVALKATKLSDELGVEAPVLLEHKRNV